MHSRYTLTLNSAQEMTIITSLLLLDFLHVRHGHTGPDWRHYTFPISSGPFAQTYSLCGLLPWAGQMAKTDLEPLPMFSSFLALDRPHLVWKNKVWEVEKLRCCFAATANRTIEFTSAHEKKVREVTKSSSGDRKRRKTGLVIWMELPAPCVHFIFFTEDAHEVTMRYKQQMVHFINGEHSAQPSCYSLNLSIVCFKSSPNRLPSSPELQDPKCVHAIISHPLPLASLLEIPLWRRQYPDSLVQLHFKDLITPVDTSAPFSAPGFSWFFPLRLTPRLWLNYWFNRRGFFLFPPIVCLSEPISVFLSSRRGVEDHRDTR